MKTSHPVYEKIDTRDSKVSIIGVDCEAFGWRGEKETVKVFVDF